MIYIIFSLLTFPLFASTVSLQQALQKLENHESWQISLEDVNLAKNNIKTIKSGVFPHLSVEGSYTKYDKSKGITNDKQEALSLQLVQPLYQGLKEWNALSISKTELEAQKHLKDATEREMKQALVQTFFNSLSIQKDLELAKELLNLSQDRENHIKKRVTIGKSRKSDLLSAQAQRLKAQASLQELIAKKENAYLSLNRMIDLERTSQLLMPSDVNPRANSLEIKNSYPAILAVNLLEASAKKQISYQKGDYHPSLDLTGNYYLHQHGISSQRDWDAAVTLSFPLYEGGETVSKVTDATIKWRKAVLQARKIKKDIHEKIDKVYQDYIQNQKRLNVLEKAVDVNLRNYNILRKEYNLGLVSNLDVIAALNQYIEEKRDFFNAKFITLSAAYQLKVLLDEIK